MFSWIKLMSHVSVQEFFTWVHEGVGNRINFIGFKATEISSPEYALQGRRRRDTVLCSFSVDGGDSHDHGSFPQPFMDTAWLVALDKQELDGGDRHSSAGLSDDSRGYTRMGRREAHWTNRIRTAASTVLLYIFNNW